MTEIPVLSENDLQAGLAEVYRAGTRRNLLTAFFGRGDPRSLSLATGETVKVIPVRSELELRSILPPLDDEEQAIAFLVPFPHDMPLDIAGRFAMNGRVRRIGKEPRLRHLFGVTEIDDAARSSSLVDYLLRPAAPGRYLGGDAVLTLDGLWTAYLRQDWHVDIQGGLALDSLLGWAVIDGRGPDFVDAMNAPEADGVRGELLDWLTARLGPAGRAIWEAWERGQGRKALGLSIICEALWDSSHAGVRMWLKTRIRDDLAVEHEGAVLNVAEQLGKITDRAMRYLERQLSGTDTRALLAETDAMVSDSEVKAELAKSPRLPSAWRMRLAHLGAKLTAGAAARTPETHRACVEAAAALDSHQSFLDDDQRPILNRADMAVRLLGWLVTRPELKLEPGNTPQGDAETLGRWYTEEGGFVDWARRCARHDGDDAFSTGVTAVVAAADDARDDLDRRFAKSLKGWHEATRPDGQVVSIANVSKRLITKFLKANDERRLLVLLLDGMAWAQAAELLLSLGSRTSAWGPMIWHEQSGRIGETRWPVMFAALPTVTEVSRSSFFAGKDLSAKEKLDTNKDPDRFQDNIHLKPFADPSTGPRLLTKSEGHTKAGGASNAALSLIESESQRVVGIIVNAIDDTLSGSHAYQYSWSYDKIASLPDLLEKSREAGRAILLVSDHGHVPADRLKHLMTPKKPGGKRYRPWLGDSDKRDDDEVVFSAEHARALPGSTGVVMPMTDSITYGGTKGAGEHGGATLAEVVAPCIFIGSQDLALTTSDEEQKLASFHPPSWWFRELAIQPEHIGSKSESAKATAVRHKVPKDSAQLDFLAQKATLPAKPTVSVGESAFGESAVLQELTTPDTRVEVTRAVDVLLARQCIMSADAFATAINIPTFRVNGFISKLQETLNLDGYEVLRLDAGTRQVHLDRVKLSQLFEVTL